MRGVDSERSYARITKTDLRKLARLAREDREDFFEHHPEWSILYRRRVLCLALCGGAALHYVNGITGVSQFELWTFYAEHPEAPFPHRRVTHRDYGESRFGRDAVLPGPYRGRRVVVQSRSVDASPADDPLEVLQRYLKAGATRTARELARYAVVLIEPEEFLGLEAWPSLILPPRR